MKIEIDRDLKDIVISALRYALGKRTYITSLTSEYIMKHPELIDKRVKEVMLRDLEYYIKERERNFQILGRYHDDKCDYDSWIILKKWLEELDVKD